MLNSLGISELEERIYRHLIEVASASVSELGAALLTSPASIRRALGTLEKRAIVSRTAGKPPRFMAAPPDIVADNLVLTRQLEINQARAELGSLADVYRHGRSSRSTDEVIEIVSGAELAALRLLQLQEHARNEVLTFIKPPFIAIDVDMAARHPLPELSEPNRSIYDASVLEIDGFLDMMRRGAVPTDQLRLHRALPTKMIIIDREVAVLPLAHDIANTTPAMILVHPSGLLDTALALFEHYWESSLPLYAMDEPEKDEWPPSGHQRVLALMLAGATDDTIARQLGISLRTVERRVRELMDKAGAKTRVQLGWHAHASGWVDHGSRGDETQTR